TEQSSDAGSFVLSATVSSELDVSYQSSDENIVSIDGNVATIHEGGIVSITAYQPGSENFLPAEEIVQNLVINLVLGAKEPDLKNPLYPNPTTGVVFVQVTGVNKIEVFDIAGRKRDDITLQDNKIDFSRVETGIYFVRITGKNNSSVTKIIK